MSLSPLTITGVSQYSSDLQTILNRAVQIAQIPIQQLQNQDSDTLQKKTLLSGLSSGVSNLAASLEALSSQADNKSLSAASSDSSVVTAQASGGASATSYTINSVTSVAKAATERTQTGYADSAATPVGSTGDFRLVVGANHYDFSVSNNTLIGLRDRINSLGAGVTASILTTAGGNYLSVSANVAGSNALELRDAPAGVNANLLTSTNPGSDLVFHLNGILVDQKSNLVNNVIPGVTLNFLDASNDPVTISLSSDRTQLSSALSNFVANYNALRSQVAAQTGAAAGLLTGNSLIVQLSSQLRQIGAQRSADGTVHGLADLGVTFDNKGQVQFDASAVDNLSDQQLEGAFAFLSSNDGLGQYAASLREFSDAGTGLIALEQQGFDRVDQALQSHIATLTDRADVMQRGLQAKLEQADALLANLESQQNTIKASLQGLSLALYGRYPDQ